MRAFGVVSLMITFVVAAILIVMNMHGTGAAKPQAQNGLVDDAVRQAAAFEAAEADRELSAYRLTHGSYEGAQVTDISGVSVRSASASAYCLQLVTNGMTLYKSSTVSQVQSAPCA